MFKKLNFEGVFIYIDEAHASNEWPIGSKLRIKQHQTDQERKECLSMFISKFPWMMDIFICGFAKVHSKISEKLNVWPFGVWIVENGIIVDHLLPKDDTTFDIDEFLSQYL